MSKKLEVTVSDSGVQFGGAWFSHESITGYTAEQLNSGDCHVTGNQYMQWLSQDASQSELAALREELAQKVVLVVRDVCELEPADSDDPECICIRASDLGAILSRHFEGVE